jgi:peptidoglycan/xylan/chitin deacetylase (PgdA/CDA1 family)
MVRSRHRSFNSVGFVSSGIVVVLMLFGLHLHVREEKYQEALEHVTEEHKKVLAVQETYVKESGDVLAGTTEANSEETVTKVKLPIIMYHYVEYVKDEGDTIRKSLNIMPHIFEDQMKDLRDAGYTTYFMSEVPDLLSGKTPLASRSAVLTFDDGYEDFYTDAFPILVTYNIKATQYVTYDFVGRKGFMNKQQLSEILASDLVEVGSHAINHYGMGRMTDTQAKFQLKESKNVFEELFALPITTFAYPYGGFNEETPQIAQKAGYMAAVSVNPGVMHAVDEMYELKRVRAGMFGTNIVPVLESLQK